MQTFSLWPLVAYFLIIVALVASILVVSRVLGERHTAAAADEPFESGIVGVGSAPLRLSAQYYLVAMFFVIFDVEALFIFAWSIAVHEAGWAGFTAMAIFICVLLAALAWLWRLGALDWGSRQSSRAAPHRSGGTQ